MRNMLLGAVACLAAAAASAAPSITTSSQPGAVKEWVVVGPFAGSTLSKPEANGATRSGFNTDYLSSIGGEAKAKLVPGQKIGETTCRRVKASSDGIVDLAKLFGELTNSTAYAFVQIDSPQAKELICFFGSDDWAKVWLNGELVLEAWKGEGRPLNPQEDRLTLKLKPGLNNLLVKVDQSSGPWALSLRKVSQKQIDQLAKEAQKAQALKSVMGMQLTCEPSVFDKTGFPYVNWEKPELLQSVYGKIETRPVRWFNTRMEEVTKPTESGRYMAYLEAKLPDGSLLRRSCTAVCVDPGWHPWMGSESYRVQAPQLNNLKLPEGVWSRYQATINAAFGQQVAEDFFFKQFGGILLAGLMEAQPGTDPVGQLDWPVTMHQDKQLAMKLKILGQAGKYAELKKPAELTVPAPVLEMGTPESARMAPECVPAIRAACQQWWDATKIPFTVVVARDNKVFYSEPFGTDPKGKPLDMDAKLGLASLTKMHAGLLLGMFLDQGLLSLDDPIGKYLPDFPTEGDKRITLRMCTNHTTGLEGHGDWGGMNNPWLDNSIRNGLSNLKPGKVAIYNGMGFDLAGKLMEVVGQKSIFRLFHEYLFEPMGHQNVTIEDLGYGINCSSMELARIGQMVMNKGSYGHLKFMSPETMAKLMPIKVKDIEPELNDPNWVYGVGFTYMLDVPENAKTDEKGNKLPILSKQTIAHGAATGAILRVDPVNNLVVSVCRPEPGPDYEKHKNAVLQAIADGMK